MTTFHAKVGTGGRLIIPAALRHRVGIGEGDTVVLDVEGSDLRVSTLKRTIDDVQAYFARFTGADAVDELIRERRDEAARD